MSWFGLQNRIIIRLFTTISFHKEIKYASRFNSIAGYWKITKQKYSVQYPERLPVTMKLTTPEFKSLLTDGVKFLEDLFNKNGYEIRIAGGAVRDLLLGNVPSDVDFATTATPDEMKDLFGKHELRLINSKGESHGTITVRINETNYEITTLRIDEVTTGRHAVVKFTKDWQEDANRRDLTINAMFLDLHGTLYDYFSGVEDLKNRRVLFVGDASKRIKEDYLRILRYFRFYGRIADKPDCHDEETLLAIKKNVEGLAKISGERIQSELFKILNGNYNVELLKEMLSLGIGKYIGLPEKCNLEELDKVANNIRSNKFVVDPMTILSSLLYNSEDVAKLTARIKPSAVCRDLAYFIVEERNKGEVAQSVRYFQKLQMFSNTSKFTRNAIIEYLKYMGDVEMLKEFEQWDHKAFPIKGHDLLLKGVTGAKELGFVLRELQTRWIDSNFTLTKCELENQITEILPKYQPENDVFAKKKKKQKKM